MLGKEISFRLHVSGILSAAQEKHICHNGHKNILI